MQSVPWPGFYIYNVTRASITGNHFVDTANKAIIAKKGMRHYEDKDNIVSFVVHVRVVLFATELIYQIPLN